MLCDELIKKDIKIIICDTSKYLIPFYKTAANFKYNPQDVSLYLKNYKK
jgi:predicted Holliday junction resolvase-like endonuclease